MIIPALKLMPLWLFVFAISLSVGVGLMCAPAGPIAKAAVRRSTIWRCSMAMPPDGPDCLDVKAASCCKVPDHKMKWAKGEVAAPDMGGQRAGEEEATDEVTRRELMDETDAAVAVFDLDWTLWNRPRFRRGPPFEALDGGLGGVRGRDGQVLDLYPGARVALAALADEQRVAVVVVSRSHREAWAREWLQLLRVDAHRSVADVLTATGGSAIFRDSRRSKMPHLREAARQVGAPLASLLYFDDRQADVKAAAAAGITALHTPGGLSKQHFVEGLELFALARTTAGGRRLD